MAKGLNTVTCLPSQFDVALNIEEASFLCTCPNICAYKNVFYAQNPSGTLFRAASPIGTNIPLYGPTPKFMLRKSSISGVATINHL